MAQGKQAIGGVLKSLSLLAVLSAVSLSEAVAATPRQLSLEAGGVEVAQQPANGDSEAIREAADRAFEEGLQLLRQGTAESLRQAIPKFEEAIRLYRQAGDKRSEAVSTLLLGRVYDSLGEKQQALDFYNQALPLFQVLGDRSGEATTLNNIGAVYNSLGEKQQALDFYNQALPLLRAVGDRGGEASTLNNIGAVYDDLGEKQQALDFYNQALPLLRAVGDRGGEASTLNNIGAVYSSLGEKQQALDFYNQALPLRRAVGDRGGEASTLNNIGAVYNSLGEKQQALDFYNQALPLYRAVGDRGGEATTLNNIGGVYNSLGEKQQALDFYNQALPLYRAVGDRGGEATTLNNIGGVYSSLGEKQQALDFYNQALPLRRAVGDRGGEASTLNNIGAVYNSLGEKQQALDFYNQALPLYRAVGDRGGEATTLTNIGAVYDSLGEKQQALDFYNQALPILRAVGDRSGEASTLNNIGAVYSSLGEKQQALDFYNQALPILRAVGDRSGEASTLNNIGGVYSSLGEKQQALDFYNQALPLLQAVGDRSGEANTLNNIGAVYNSLGEKQQALDYFNQALPLRRAVGDRSGEASTLNNIGGVYSSLGEKQQALDFYNQALPLLQAVGDRSGEANTLNNIGAVYNSLGEKQQALDYFNQALPLRRAVGDRGGEATTLYNLAFLERDQGKFATALPHIEAAIEIIEDLRSNIGSQELRTSYFATVQNYYQLYIDLLMRLHQQNPNQGYDAQALHISERARARSLLELLAEANADIRTGVDPELLEREQNLLQQLNALEHDRYQLATRQYSESEMEEIKAKSQALLSQLDQLEAQIRINSPRYADLQYPEPLTLREIQLQVLDEDTLLLQYSLGQDRSYLWAVTKDSITSYELPAAAEIDALAQDFHEELQSLSPPSQDLALQLSDMILSPVAAQLGNKRLLIVGDGSLQYVPFAALPAPNTPKTDDSLGYTPLLVQHEIVTSSSASTVAISRRTLANRSPGSKMLAVLADPVFEENDPRFDEITARDDEANPNLERSLLGIGEAGQSLNRLQYTRDEAEAILALVPESQRLEALDFAAERELITSADLADYQIVHLATHGLLNEQNPELSGLVLSLFEDTGEAENGFLRLHDIFNLNLPAELVVLSACETGLGENVRGEGLVGLTRGFMYAGAKRVVVSLWKVNDVQTSVLMKQFYERMLNEEQNPVAALRAAQLQMWEAGKSPYYWAAFTVQGDWR